MKILLPVDGSPYTKRMLGYVAAHEELFGPQHEYIFATVVGPVPPHVTHFIDRATLNSYYDDEAEKVLSPALKFAAQHGWNARRLHAQGPAPEVLAALAKAEKVDLIVMGSHGHSALGNMILGSVATGVLARCDAPVLLIR
jgi:nucleotide-binding universal stress UspA family protein